MGLSVVGRAIVVGAIVGLPVIGYAQEATLIGTVTDPMGGVLPGVTVSALQEMTGNSFETVTDERGDYRMSVRVGLYRITAKLPGFTSVTRSGLELLVRQQAVVNFQLALPGIEESVTATMEAPLIDVTSSSLGGNIDPRQMQELPVNGRNWLDLTMLAPGSRANAVDEAPAAAGAFQLNVDGQQVTQNILVGFGQPRYSRDSIAEFEFVSKRFDATQGRSSGLQVNAITKSGTNTLAGTVSGYFRDDRLNAADFVQGRVLPYSNQQISATLGGPIRKDRIHFFANYEYEREPQTFSYSSPWPLFNMDQTGTRRDYKGGVRLDFQFSPKTRLAVRGNKYSNLIPYDPARTGGGTRHPSSAQTIDRFMNDLLVSLTHVLNEQALNDLKVGYAGFYWVQESHVNWANHPQRAAGVTKGAPSILLRGYTIGQTLTTVPQRSGQETYSIRDDFSYSFTGGGHHDLKFGGEYLYIPWWSWLCRNCMGTLDAQGGPIPGNIEDLFPVWNDVSTWNLAALSPIARRYTVNVGNFSVSPHRKSYAAWVQDDWAIMRRLTLNIGLRYDLTIGMWANWVALPPFLKPNRPDDKDNIGPRLGFAYSLTSRTVLRGGFGKYFAEVSRQPASWTVSWAQQAQPEVLNDGRPDFAANPFNGPIPTFEQLQRNYCSAPQAPGCVRRNVSNLAMPDLQVPYTYQTSIGVQRQLGETMVLTADYVYAAGRHELFTRNINLSYDPVTGTNYPFTDIERRPYPDWGVVNAYRSEGRSSYHALQTAFTKRFSQRWQASAAYLLSALWDADSSPAPFKVAPDLGGEYSLAASDQRHRAVLNGIWSLPNGFQLSGIYFFGSGERFAATYGGDLRATGASGGRLRPDGTVVPRNYLVGEPIHRVDLRIQRRFRLSDRVGIDALLDAFNLFNHANYGSYVTAESNPNYGRPSDNTNVAYQPRMLQLGFRATF